MENNYRTDGYTTGVPKALFPHVLEFCKTISNNEPVYVPIRPEGHALLNECFPNVEEMVKKCGGKSVIGWQIWELYGIMIEAEFHAVWLSPKNELIDITPKSLPLDRILFLEDPNAHYEEKQVNNIRKSLLKGNKDVEEFIQIHDKMFAIYNDGDKAIQKSITSEQQKQYEALSIESINPLLKIFSFTPGRNQLCRCGSGKKYKNCHGPR